MKTVYEIATGKAFEIIHNVDAIEAVRSGYYSYELPVKTEETVEPVKNRKAKKDYYEPSYADPPLSV